MKKALEYTPLIYAGLVFIGYMNLHVYYSQFSIPIWSYLSLGELLLSFLPLTLALLASLVPLAFLFLLTSEKKPESLAEFTSAWA